MLCKDGITLVYGFLSFSQIELCDVLKEARDGNWTHASWDWREDTGDFSASRIGISDYGAV